MSQADPAQDYSSAVMYGAFGVRNMWSMYPMTGWSFLIGAVIGIVFGVGQRFGPRLMEKWRRRSRNQDRWDEWHAKFRLPLDWLYKFNPPVFVSGMVSEST